jgi:hypothetical protein
VRVHRRDLGGRLAPAQAFVPPSASPSTAHLTLELVATTPRAAQLRARASAPPGFTVTPPRTSMRVRSNGSPATVEMPFAVTVPAGTPEGEYPIRVTASMDGAAPIARTAAVIVREAHCAGPTGGFCPLDLARDANHDGVATLDSPAQGDFDGSGWSFAANLLPAPGPVTLAGVPYRAPPTAGDERNFVEARGQSLAVPAGRWATAYVLGATHNGDVDSAATVTYDDGSTATVPLRLTDWAGRAAFGNTTTIAMPYRLRAGQGQDGPPVAIFGTRLALDPGKTARSIALPGDPRIELYAITLGD